MSTTVSGSSRTVDLVTLAERLRFLQLTRVGLALLLLLGRVTLPALGGLPLERLVVATACYLAVCGVGEFLWRATSDGPGRGLRVFGALLLADGAFLASVAFHSGGVESPVRLLVLVHVVTVMLLASYRTGLKIALWHSLLVFVVYRLQHGGVFAGTSMPEAGPVRERLVVYVVVLWVMALATATFSAVNERELRRRRYDMQVLAGMAQRLAQDGGSAGTAQVLLDTVSESLDFTDGVVLAGDGSRLTLVATVGAGGAGVTGTIGADWVPGRPGPGVAVRAALVGREAHLVARTTAVEDPILAGVLPRLTRVILVPLLADGAVLGLLVLLQPESAGDTLDRRRVVMLEQLAAHAALALRNASLLKQLQAQARTDGLTGVANRRSFDTALSRDLSLASRGAGPLTLLLIDVDHFKDYNDAHGHQAGDDVLQTLASVLQESMREGDTVARYGGEEFAVLLPATGVNGGHDVAERLRARVRRDTDVTVSIGLATTGAGMTDAFSLLASADTALYDAKNHGRDQTWPPVEGLAASSLLG